MTNEFYFSQHFAPIINPQIYNTRPKRFGYVLRLMRETKKLLAESEVDNETGSFTQEWLGEKLGLKGNKPISNWEQGEGSMPSPDQMDLIIKAFDLDVHDGNYLRNLAYGGSELPTYSNDELTTITSNFKRDYDDYEGIAYVLDSLMYVLEANKAFYGLMLDLNPNADTKSRIHILKLVFDPFSGILTMLGKDQWKQLVPVLIWQLRYHTTDLRHTSDYISLLWHLSEDLETRFTEYWNRDYSNMPSPVVDIQADMPIYINGRQFLVKSFDQGAHGNFLTYRIVYYEPHNIATYEENTKNSSPIVLSPFSKPKADENILVFVSYRHNDENGYGDEELARRLIGHLRGGLKDEKITIWSDLDIEITADWHETIQENLNNANIFIALVSHGYMHDSTYIKEQELAPAIQKRGNEGMPIFPVILSPCRWKKHTLFSSVQHLPSDNKALSEYESLESSAELLKQFVKIEEELSRLASKLRN